MAAAFKLGPKGGQNTADCFEQLGTCANDSYHFKENLFFDQFSHFL